MISYSVLIIILLHLVEFCPANRRVSTHYSPTSSPRGSERKPTHISEFTDPATGLNPFLDLEEGRAGEMGRSIVDEEQPIDSDLQMIEGGPDDQDRGRWNGGFGRRWENLNNNAENVVPASDATPTGRKPEKNKMHDQFTTPTETNSQVSPGVLLPSTKNSDLLDYYALTPQEDLSSDAEYNSDYHAQEAEETAVIREDSVRPKKIPISKNVLISAAITGASVAVVALLLAICWWRRKMKRVSTRGNVEITDSTVESSMSSDKTSRNSIIQKKSISA